MIIVGIENETVVTIFDWAKSIEEITVLPEGMVAKIAPDNVVPGWYYKDGNYIAPEQSGFRYDDVDNKYYSHEEYRGVLHQRTVNDTLQAMRKIREGDTSYDWQGWLNRLDAYNKAVSDTKNQPTYPDKVTYPEYPTR